MGGWYQRILWTAAVLPAAAALPAQADPIPPVAEASNMQVIGHSDLNGAGKGGEGLALAVSRWAADAVPRERVGRRCASASST